MGAGGLSEMKKIWVKRPSSHEEVKSFDKKYYSSMSRKERLEIVQFLREAYYKLGSMTKNEGRKRLRRVVKIVQ